MKTQKIKIKSAAFYSCADFGLDPAALYHRSPVAKLVLAEVHDE